MEEREIKAVNTAIVAMEAANKMIDILTAERDELAIRGQEERDKRIFIEGENAELREALKEIIIYMEDFVDLKPGGYFEYSVKKYRHLLTEGEELDPLSNLQRPNNSNPKQCPAGTYFDKKEAE